MTTAFAPTPQGTRNLPIDILRGVSILLVLLHHFNIPYKLAESSLSLTVFGSSLSQLIARNGNYGVTIFFVVSGFLITSHALVRWGTLAQVQMRDFYVMRIARIIPSLLLLLLIVNVLSLTGWAPFQNHAPNGLAVSYPLVNLASLTFWMNVLIIKYGWVNYALGVLWSLSVEEVFYLTFPIACLWLKKVKYLIPFWLLVIVIAPIYRALHQGDSEAYLYGYLASFDGIAIGCCTAVIARAMLEKSIVISTRLRHVIQSATIIAMITLYLAAPIASSNIYGVTLMALGAAILLLGSVLKPKTMAETRVNFAARAVASLGKNSYELYLFHLIILGLIKVLYPPASTSGDVKIGLLVAFLLGSVLLSSAIARYYSNPLNRLIRQTPTLRVPQS